jgi:hypothetical protein
VPPTTAPNPAPLDLRLNRISAPPGGTAIATGQGCVGGSPVTLSIGAMQVGTAVANSDGTFTAPLQLNVPVGRYVVTARCGVTLTAAISVVLSTQANPPAAASSLLLVLLLVLLLAFGIQFGRR